MARLNLAVPELVAAQGGAIIVDATRRGKAFPDALSKTVPIWCAVINRAIQELRRRHPEWDEGAPAPPWWDDALHLPPWITPIEAAKISERLDGWVQLLLTSGPDLRPLARTLHKPLRPLWVSQDTRVFTNMLPALADLAFAPLVLVSASKQRSRPHRATLELDGQPFSYSYLPGAGDDEESWSRGLTAAQLRMHYPELIRAGPGHVEAVVATLLGSTPAFLRKAKAGSSVYIPPKGLAPRPKELSETAASYASSPFSSISPTGLSLGSNETVLSPSVWDRFDLILNVGERPLPSPVTEALGPPTTMAIPLDLHDHDRIHVPPSLRLSRLSREHVIRELRQSPPRPDNDRSAMPCMYLHLPLRDTKHERHVLLHRLDFLLCFLDERRDARVLIVDDTGTDLCVGVALALTARVSLEPGGPLSRGTRSKEELRSLLGGLSAVYPQAQPRQATLKQVFQYFSPASANQ